MSKNLIDISRRQADQLVQQAEFSRELFIKMEEHDKKMACYIVYTNLLIRK